VLLEVADVLIVTAAVLIAARSRVPSGAHGTPGHGESGLLMREVREGERPRSNASPSDWGSVSNVGTKRRSAALAIRHSGALGARGKFFRFARGTIKGRATRLLFPETNETRNLQRRSIECRQRLGGLLKYYRRAA